MHFNIYYLFILFNINIQCTPTNKENTKLVAKYFCIMRTKFYVLIATLKIIREYAPIFETFRKFLHRIFGHHPCELLRIYSQISISFFFCRCLKWNCNCKLHRNSGNSSGIFYFTNYFYEHFYYNNKILSNIEFINNFFFERVTYLYLFIL